MKIFIAPILLKKAASIKFPLFIDKDVLIRDFPIEEREKFFGVEELEIKGAGATHKPALGRDIFREAFVVGYDYFSLLRAENCIEIKGSDEESPHILQEKMEFMNRALKILKSGSAGVLIGKFFGERSGDFPAGATTSSGINPLYGGSYILKKYDILELKSIYHIISKRKDEKTTMLLEKFILAVSKNLRKHMRALEFFSILEALYLPGTEYGELRFKLSHRIAKMMFSKAKRYENYKEVKGLYDKRCILVHQSKDVFTYPEFFVTDYLEKLFF